MKHVLNVFLLLMYTFTMSAQQETSKKDQSLLEVSGKIIDATTNSPIAGARVQTLDLKLSAMTGEDGSFSLKLSQSQTILTVSAPDYALREYPLQGKSDNIVISLYSTVFTNNYSRVLTPFGDQRQQELTRAQSSVSNMTNLSGLTVVSDIQTHLGGDVRALTHSGAPAIGATMFVRGLNSLNTNAQPLVVVDGIIWDAPQNKISIHQGYIMDPLSNLNPDDIESISLLKDGTSIYGSKGGNGVILIKTRRGKDMATKITFSSNIGLNTKPDFIPMMDAAEYRVYASDLMKSAEEAGMNISNIFLKDDPTTMPLAQYKRYHNNTNWSKVSYRNSITQNYHIGVNGGDEVALYNLSVGYTNAESTLKENDFTRLNARFNTDINFGSKFKLAFDISYSQIDRNLRDDGFAEDMTLGPLTSPGVLSMIKAPFLAPYTFTNQGGYTKNSEVYDFLGYANPAVILRDGVGTSQQSRFDVNFIPEYRFTPDLSIKSQFNYSFVNLSEHYFRPMDGVAPFLTQWSVLYNQVKTQFLKQNSIFSNTYIDWSKTFDIHQVDLKGGFRYMVDTFRGDFASGYNTGSNRNKEMSNSLTNRTAGGVDDTWKSMSWYLDGAYSLQGKYFFDGVVALDASSRFGDDVDSGIELFNVNYGVFPSANAAWLVSAENFMKDVPVISLAKIRAGYGLSGNDGIESNATKTYFNAVRYLYKSTGLQLANIGNPKLQWETTRKFNVGLDVALFDDRLFVSADYFNHVTDDLLTLKEHTYISGLKSYWTNEGKLENKGYEFSFNAKVLNLRDFKWELGASISKYTNKIKALPDGDYTTSIYGAEILTAVGKSAGVFYGYKTNGIYSTAAEATADGLSTPDEVTGVLKPFSAGDVRFVNVYDDADNINIIDENDKVVIGDPNPDFIGTITTNMRYKRFALNATFTYSYGNDVYNYYRSQLESGSNFYNQTSAMNRRWVSETQNASLPKSVYGDPMRNNRFSDRWIEDGSYIRLKNVSLSYDVPVKWSFIQGLTVWTSATNLFTLTKYLGTDPDFSMNSSVLYQGIDTGLLSQGRSYYLGVKVNL